MEPTFWHNRWAEGRIGFHLPEANPMLVDHAVHLQIVEGDSVLVPLCGKSKDMTWLADCGIQVVGCELSETAVKHFFAENDLTPTVERRGPLVSYRTDLVTIWAGDIFDLSADAIGQVDAIYDRAALVALPSQMRDRYSQHLLELTSGAKQLLLCFSYDQRLAPGPPFSITAPEIERLYGDSHDLRLLRSTRLVDGLRGTIPAQESAWLLSPQG